MTAMVEVRRVEKSFGDVRALRGVDLEVGEGRVCGLLGPNGAGKTTLVRILSTLQLPDRGSVRVAGFDVVREAVTVRSLIGLAGQYAAVDELLTGRENLRMVARLYRLSRREAAVRADEVLERLSLTDAANRPVRTYSGGMRRRLDVGASLVGRPRVLILDEPTTGLDPRTRQEMWRFIEELVSDGATLLLTTQYLEEADRLADSVTVIDRGTVIAEGTVEELKSRLHGDVLEVRVGSPDDLVGVRSLLEGIHGERATVEREALRVSVVAPDGAGTLTSAVLALHGAGIAITDIALRHPSLEEVFLSLTGEDHEEAAA